MERGRCRRHRLVALFEEALAALPDRDSSVRARANARLASGLYFLDDETDRRTALTAEAVAMAERVGDDDTRAFVLGCALAGAWMPGNEEDRVRQGTEVIELGRRSGNLVHELTGNV